MILAAFFSILVHELALAVLFWPTPSASPAAPPLSAASGRTP